MNPRAARNLILLLSALISISCCVCAARYSHLVGCAQKPYGPSAKVGACKRPDAASLRTQLQRI
jgi:hypothetical protein